MCTLEVEVCPNHSNSLVQASLNLINDYYSDSDSDICVHFLDSSVNLCIPNCRVV